MNWQAAARMFSACLALTVVAIGLSSDAAAAVRINEIYWDPPSSLDSSDEFIELYGDPNMSLTQHYLIFLENEKSASANPGTIDNIFNLGALSPARLGSNGFLTLRQGGSSFGSSAAGTRDFINTAVPFTWGSGASSSVGHSDAPSTPGGQPEGVIENSGWTALLLRNTGGNANRPLLNTDLDANDDGVFDFAGMSNWTILDSIGVIGEESEAGASSYLYGAINFGPLDPNGNPPSTPAGSTFVQTTYEIEYVARWGNSSGSAASDWHASNLTNEPLGGATPAGVYVQSGLIHDPPPIRDGLVESTQGVPYATELLNTRGSHNLFYRDGDFDFDGDVDGRDFLIWQRNYGYSYSDGAYTGDGVANDATRNHGDINLDKMVDGADLALWEALYATPPALTAAITTVPEPGALALGCLACGLLGWRRGASAKVR